MPTRFTIKGNASLIIFQKYLNYINISKYQFFLELMNILIKRNKKLFIKQVESGEKIIKPYSRLSLLFENLKSQTMLSQIEEIPEYDTLSKEELREIMKRLTQSKLKKHQIN